MTGYTLHVPPVIERRICQLAALTQRAIRAALKQTVLGAATSRFATRAQPLDPPLRFYTHGYRVLYQVEADTHRVVVVQLRKAFA
ncbi:MAG: hypothetical protein M3Y59_11205 [Myxococcota bacterium]|nr:hypothetical protein [Myxococcota bacterium]